MRTGKDIDFTKVDFITYAIDEYYKDIPFLTLVSFYMKIWKYDEACYMGEYEQNGKVHKVIINANNNLCLVDCEPKNPEEFVILFEGEGTDPVPIIKKVTGVDLDEYISDVTYSNGVTELLDVKGKTFLLGTNKRVINGD